MKMKLLCLSNGHGEDSVAVRVLQALQQHSSSLELAALPLVGEGLAYRNNDIPIIGPVKGLPSGGFIYMDGRQVVRDLQKGLLSLTLKQLRFVKQWAASGGAILAVGDIVPLLFAWYSGASYGFIGTAKSEYYLRDEAGPLPRTHWFEQLERWSGSVYLPWERWLMSRPQCKAVFPRDRLTTETLRQWNIPAFELGNPMMDGLEPTGLLQWPHDSDQDAPEPLTVSLLPGSRPPEAYENWQRILQAVNAVVPNYPNQPLHFIAAIAPTLEVQPLQQMLMAAHWHPQQATPGLYQQQHARLLLTRAFNDCLHHSHVAIAMAGTATEQFVGLGKPAIILPGKGPQFTPAFAEAQTRLLGASVTLASTPLAVPSILNALLHDADRLHLIAENGQRRMGLPGAAHRIASCLRERLLQ